MPLNITTVPLLGLSAQGLKERLFASTHAAGCAGKPPHSPPSSAVFLAAPLSAHLFDNNDAFRAEQFLLREHEDPPSGATLFLEMEFVYRKHVNLDDLDFADDGVLGTVSRVFGRAGLGVWRVRTNCSTP